MIAVQGPKARAKLWQALPGSQAASAALKAVRRGAVRGLFIARTGYTGEDGFEITLPRRPARRRCGTRSPPPACGRAGSRARDTLRLEAGMNLYGQDMTEADSPLESGLAWTVDLAVRATSSARRPSPRAPATRNCSACCCRARAACCAATRRS